MTSRDLRMGKFVSSAVRFPQQSYNTGVFLPILWISGLVRLLRVPRGQSWTRSLPACLASHVTTACWPRRSLFGLDSARLGLPQRPQTSFPLGFPTNQRISVSPRLGMCHLPTATSPSIDLAGLEKCLPGRARDPLFRKSLIPEHRLLFTESWARVHSLLCSHNQALGHVFCLLLCKLAHPWTRSGCRERRRWCGNHPACDQFSLSSSVMTVRQLEEFGQITFNKWVSALCQTRGYKH